MAEQILTVADSYGDLYGESPGVTPNLFILDISDCYGNSISEPAVLTAWASLNTSDSYGTFQIFYPELTTGGGYHDNTKHITYNGTNYLKCRHLHGQLTGTYKSPIFDTAVSADRYLAYIVGQDTTEADIVVVGTGTTWDSQIPSGVTWDEINISSRTWTNIFTLDSGPSVTMRLYYGQTSPPTNYVDRQEILSAIVSNAKYFQVEITITDPSSEIYAYVEEFYLRLCQAA